MLVDKEATKIISIKLERRQVRRNVLLGKENRIRLKRLINMHHPVKIAKKQKKVHNDKKETKKQCMSRNI